MPQLPRPAGNRVGPVGLAVAISGARIGEEFKVARSVAGGWSRRRVLTFGLGGAVAAAIAGVSGIEFVSNGTLPGKTVLDRLDGACSVPGPSPEYSPPGPSFSGAFYSQARHRRAGYTIAYPPGHGSGDDLPLVVMLHAFGGNHANALAGMSPAGRGAETRRQGTGSHGYGDRRRR